jgi:integrase
MIKRYIDRIKNVSISEWTVQELKEFLISKGDISFSDFARKYIDGMRNEGRDGQANNYTAALNSMEAHFKTKDVSFYAITSKKLREWIDSLSETKRAKQMYPIIIKKLFNEGRLEYNDYDRNVIRIQNQPFMAVKIPGADVPNKRSIEIDSLKRIFRFVPETANEELAHDVALITFCLAGINTIDLYNMEKSEFIKGKLCYNRTKTKKERKDKAYIEILAPERILPLFDKYAGKKRLFDFRERYSDVGNFRKYVNKGLKSICEKVNRGIDEEKEDRVPDITVYWLRHTWATIAQNNCKASTEMVAFCLNHTSAHRTTEGYIKKDFTPIDELNRKVLDIALKGV